MTERNQLQALAGKVAEGDQLVLVVTLAVALWVLETLCALAAPPCDGWTKRSRAWSEFLDPSGKPRQLQPGTADQKDSRGFRFQQLLIINNMTISHHTRYVSSARAEERELRERQKGMKV